MLTTDCEPDRMLTSDSDSGPRCPLFPCVACSYSSLAQYVFLFLVLEEPEGHAFYRRLVGPWRLVARLCYQGEPEGQAPCRRLVGPWRLAAYSRF